MEIINTSHAPAAVGPYSQGIQSGNFYFFSGQIALTSDGNFLDQSVEAQTEQIFKNITALLKEAKLSKEQVIKATVFLADISDFQAVNTLYAEFFGTHKPARSCVEVSKLPLNAKVEIEIIGSQNWLAINEKIC